MKFFENIKIALAAAAFAAVSACASTGSTPVENSNVGANGPAAETSTSIKPPTPIGSTPTNTNGSNTIYTLGNGDTLRVTVFGEPDLSGEFQVDGTGIISMPLIGEVEASGKTVRQVQRDMEELFRSGYLNNPRISAEVINFRPYYILGEVGRPGEYPYTDGLTVFNAVATAQGFTYRANEKVVFIRGANDSKEREVRLTSTTDVTPGDTIRIGERLF